MLSNTVKITTPSNNISDQVPADVYQIQISDVTEADGTDYNTKEPIKQLKFMGVIVEGEYEGKFISFFTSQSWFNGGKNSKPSKLFNLIKNVYAHYKKDVKVSDVPVITADDVNGLVGKQVRVATEVNDKGWPKVTSFMPVKKEIEYKENLDRDIPDGKEDVNPDEVEL